MLVPDFWKGRGRYSKQAICRKPKGSAVHIPPEGRGSETEKPQGLG